MDRWKYMTGKQWALLAVGVALAVIAVWQLRLFDAASNVGAWALVALLFVQYWLGRLNERERAKENV